MINTEDIPGFFAEPSSIDPERYLFFDYLFESYLDPRFTAAQLCSEQSTAQWRRAHVDEDLRTRFGAKVVSLEVLSESSKPIYPLPTIKGERFFLCKARVAHPVLNFGARIPNLLSAMAGEGPFYCPGISTLKICDITFPQSFLKEFQGPQFGVGGLRELLQIFDRPFFVGVVKPNIGLNPKDFAELALESWLGGLDIAKDDEMLADTPWSQTSERMQATYQARIKAEKETKKPKMMIANVTDEVDVIGSVYEKAASNGANAVMLNGLFTGVSAIRALRKKSELPIMGHFTGLALYDRMTHFGIDAVVWVKFQRLCGCDIIGLPGFGERMHTTDEVVLKNIKACLEPLGNIKPSLPIPGGSDWAGTLPSVYAKIGHPNFGFIAGRGIYGHPSGPQAGAQSLHQAWEAVSQKIPLQDYAKNHRALKESMGIWK